MSETGITLLAFGIVLLLNIISLILVYVTPYGKDYIETLKRSCTKGQFIFWNIWMCLVGVAFWPIVGIVELVKAIRG